MGRGRKPARDRGRHFRSEKDVSDEEEKSSGDDRWGPRKMTIQPQRNLGLPPSDSEEEESSDEEGGPSNSRPQEEIRIREIPMKQQVRDPNPPSDSSEEDESSSEDDLMNNEYLRGPSRAQQARVVEKAAAAQVNRDVKADLKRIEEIRAKRESDRLARIAKEGWDRFAPVSETNKPPVVPKNKD